MFLIMEKFNEVKELTQIVGKWFNKIENKNFRYFSSTYITIFSQLLVKGENAISLKKSDRYKASGTDNLKDYLDWCLKQSDLGESFKEDEDDEPFVLKPNTLTSLLTPLLLSSLETKAIRSNLTVEEVLKDAVTAYTKDIADERIAEKIQELKEAEDQLAKLRLEIEAMRNATN